MTHSPGDDRGFLIVGASGFLGKAIRQALEDSGRPASGTSTTGQESGLYPFDLRADAASKVLNALQHHPEWAVVCACISQIDRCAREREFSRQINVERTQQLLGELRDRGIRPIFISTSYVFDGREGNYTEDTPVSPTCEYGRQKAEVERWLQEEIPEAAILRLDKLVSAESHASNLLHQWYEQASSGNVIRCIAEQRFSPTATCDIAAAVLQVADQDLRGIYHVTGSETWGRAELADHFLQRLGIQSEIREVPQAEFKFDDLRPLRTSLNNQRFVDRTGIRFQTMEGMIEQYQHQLRIG